MRKSSKAGTTVLKGQESDTTEMWGDSQASTGSPRSAVKCSVGTALYDLTQHDVSLGTVISSRPGFRKMNTATTKRPGEEMGTLGIIMSISSLFCCESACI